MPKLLRALCVQLICAGALAAGARAQDRPDEAEMFGAPAAEGGTTEPPAATPSEPAPSEPAPGAVVDTTQPAVPAAAEPAKVAPELPPASTRDDSILGGSSTPMFDQPVAPEDPLTLGGQIYIRAQTRVFEDSSLGEASFNLPALVDLYFDARPNDRVRGYVLGRMIYDPTSDVAGRQLLAGESASGSGTLANLYGVPATGPQVRLDQLWLRFDIAHTVFITAGKQHVRWGTGHVWSPTDYLHVRPRNPLEVFDARTGSSMVKVHLPIESNAWNFYAYGVAEGPDGVPSLEYLGGAARAELVFGTTEIGLGAYAQKGIAPKFAADASTGIGDFDIFLEAALRNLKDVDRVHYDPDAELPMPDAQEPWQSDTEYRMQVQQQYTDVRYPSYRAEGYRPQLVAGVAYSVKYNDNDVLTFSAEYFYNPLGYDNSDVYPGLLAPRSRPLTDPANYFYLGRHYAALVVSMPSPFSLDLHSFTLSTLGNLSDRSFVTQLQYSLVLLTHLRLEAYIAARYGRPTGEFRLRIELEGKTVIPAALFDSGIALRLSI
ncbi:MAG TPA: hypothetical protein VJV78_44420 [Polyangiales bacterium]|nr:hypothetical protein [Polyangiales bacterium]